MSIHLIMPMGGRGSRFSEKGLTMPKPLIPIHQYPFLYWAAEFVCQYIDIRSITFVVLKEHVENFKIDEVIRNYYPNANIHVLNHVLNGAVLTCLAGVEDINDGNPILFNDCDHIFICHDFVSFCNFNQHEDIDGALLTFASKDPKFSFLEIDQDGWVKRTVEKEAISNQAICGAYYFKNRNIFETAAQQYLKQCTYKEFYISGVYNIMANNGGRIRSFTVDMHLPFGTPEEYDFALKSDKFEVHF